MPLSDQFQFSQSSLQDYVDCPRRFELRYILHQQWPALQTEPVIEFEQHLEQGKQFHKMVQQLLLGIPAEKLSALAKGPDLQRWWDHFLTSAPLSALPKKQFPEHRLSTTLGGYRFVAQYDLLAIEPGEKAVIVDWKTSQRRTRSRFLKNRLQTRLYPLLLAESGNAINHGQPIFPNQIEMIYWFSDFPQEPEIISYDEQLHEANHQLLLKLVEEISKLEEDEFALTEDEKHCRFCRYRSLCKRGRQAGNMNEDEEGTLDQSDDLLDLNLDMLLEIEF